MLQNFAHFQQFSRPGAGGNTFARVPEVPRCEAACALCQRKDWIEHRYKLNLFGEAPEEQQARTCDVGGAPQPADSEGAPPEDTDDEDPLPEKRARQPALVKQGDVYFLQSPEAVHALLNVERYATRWPLIPGAELHASSVQHPQHPDWRWLLHVRRVPVKPPPG